MEFATPVVQQCHERIAPIMKELFGEFAQESEEYPMFSISMGSAYIQIAINPWDDDNATVQAWAWVVTGAEITADLMRYLLGENVKLRFGSYGVDEEGDIMLQQSIVATTCDKAELKALVLSVLYTADRVDDELIAKYGGQRAIDRSS